VLRLLRTFDPPDAPATDLAAAERVFARYAGYPDYTLYVAEDGGEVVGTFALLVLDNLAHGLTPAGLVESVAVAEDRRSQGIGAAMMRFAMARCAEAGCYKLALSSNLVRADAHRFYERLGFVRHGLSFSVALPGPVAPPG
jgi:GNAT superfamily N-acetyltransferase